jgi:protein-disulfide isomerase
MPGKETFSNLATGLLVLCAVAVTGMAVRNQFFPPDRGAQRPEAPRTIRSWKSLAEEGSVLGAPDARVTIVEFSDFQCPYCAQLSKTLRSMQASDPARFRVVYRHYPLAQHTHATDAAVAAECAGKQDRFAEYHDALFAAQDSIGSRAWTRFGSDAGVADTTTLQTCMAGTDVRARVDADAKTAARLRLPGTPSIIVNGRLYTGAITEADLGAMIDASE